MKKLLILSCLLLGIIINTTAQKSYRNYFKTNERTYTLKSVTTETSVVDSTQWFAPVANISVLYFSDDGYKVGIIPGLGYGWMYKPKSDKGKENYLLSVQGFLQAGIVKTTELPQNYTHLTIGPSLGLGVLGGKVIVGYSWQFDIGFNGNPTTSDGMFFLSTTLISF
jgi:hypothetical protein